jgi:hypothetical protein
MTNDRTAHAVKRMQQRCIPELVIDLLQRCGSWIRCNGADRLIFDKAAVKRLRRYLVDSRAFAAVERWLGVYAVFNDDGLLVTVAHRTRRHVRN